jgi:uncharacterized protein (TIGR00661 family)
MGLSYKKCLFLVQGEGRGHITQSISMKQIVENAGMKVCEVLVGKSKQRIIPAFYYERMAIPVTAIDSPNMISGKKKKAIKLLPSIIGIILGLPKFFYSLRVIHRKIKEHKPDVIINFYEPLAGFYYLLLRPKIPMVCIGHHYLFNHPGFEMAEGNFFTKIGLKIYTGLTSFGAKRKLALSFYPFSDYMEKSIYVVPPLLREEVRHQTVSNGDYLLVYLLNNGYMEDIIKWHKKNPGVKLHCFLDKKNIPDSLPYDATLSFHRICDKKFLEYMANSKGLVSTAGFESVCEAMYLGKPVFMVPVEKHYEQFCNSRDAAKAGAGLYDKSFEMDRFLTYISNFHNDGGRFRDWVNQSHFLTIKHIYGVLVEDDNVRQLHPAPQLRRKLAFNS